MVEDKGRSGIGIWKAKQMKQELEKQRSKGRRGWGGLFNTFMEIKEENISKMFSVPRLPIHKNRSLCPTPVMHPTSSLALYGLPKEVWDISMSNNGFLSNWSFLHPPAQPNTWHSSNSAMSLRHPAHWPYIFHLLSPPSLLFLPTSLVPGPPFRDFFNPLLLSLHHTHLAKPHP